MKALTAAEMREVDRLTTERYGVSGAELMESAGKHIANAVLGHFSPALPKRIAVLCGKGNNGGDGLVAARHLRSAGIEPGVYLFGDPQKMHGEAAGNFIGFVELKSESDWERVWPDIANCEVVVDALLGTGLRGAATGLFARAIEDVNHLSKQATAARPALILAVDTPSGLTSDGERSEGPVLRAHHTVTFTAPKVGQLISRDADAVGTLEVRDIGSPTALVEEIGKGMLRWAGPDEFARLPLVRSVTSHKGTFGHVLIIAGSLGKTGAAILSGRGALRTGAGLVTIATPDLALPIVAAGQPEYMTEPLRSMPGGIASDASANTGAIQELLKGKTVMGLGPGLGMQSETQKFIRNVVLGSALPTILDADGLNAFTGQGDLLRDRASRFLALTPHPGEMARLLGSTSTDVQADRAKMALDAARRWNVHIVLKGYHTIVASPRGEIFVNTTGNAGLAKGGSGDILTGILAALIAQFGADDGARILSLGVYVHGLAAQIACRGTDMSGLLASEVADAVPHARLKLLEELRQSG